MPYIVIFIQLCAAGWCPRADHIVNAPSVDACNAWVKAQYVQAVKNGVIVSCVPMPGWTSFDPAKPAR